jgi:hypothetical protein
MAASVAAEAKGEIGANSRIDIGRLRIIDGLRVVVDRRRRIIIGGRRDIISRRIGTAG